jgi:hypothetical protein
MSADRLLPSTPELGWLGFEDRRKAAYPLQARLTASVRRNVSYAMFGYPLDQGKTGTCVGFAGKHWELTAPVIGTKRLGPPTGIDFYLAATERDQWHGGQPDTTLKDGTSLTALMLGFRDKFQLITGFDWTDDPDTILDFMCGDDGGPVVLGLPWYRSMFETTEEGFLTVDPASGLAGGHAILCSHVNVTRGFLSGPNSWGRPADFGRLNKLTGQRDGRWRLDLDRLLYLLDEGGDCVAARQLPRAA